MTWRDHVVMLLHIGAAVEHALMVQYLYAAYSIGGDQIPQHRRAMVQRWRDGILSIAKEEMGHLLTVQNMLALLGAPINLDRQDFPWDIEYYPFPFSLEPFSINSLCCYIYAEMPASPEESACDPLPGKRRLPRYLLAQASDDEIKHIVDQVKSRFKRKRIHPHLHRVGKLYEGIISILGNRDQIPDSAFNENSYTMQASWDDWGRGYKPAPRPLDAEGNVVEADLPPASKREAHVLIDRVATRSQVIKALRALSAQGEAPHLGGDETGEPSHFERLLEIYRELNEYKDEGWRPAREVPVNPTTAADHAPHERGSLIRAKCAQRFAELFNLRYRMLLNYLAHTFSLARVTPSDRPSVRAAVMHRVFGEMYNLKTIAGILVRLPRLDGTDGSCAGPPFEMPYTLNLPPRDIDIWQRHRDLLGSSDSHCYKILYSTDPDVRRDLEAVGGEVYLKTLLNLDSQTRAWTDQILAGSA